MVSEADTGAIKNQYIVVFKDEWPGLGKAAKVRQVSNFTDTFLSDNQIPGDSVLARYELALRGFAARMSSQKTVALSKNPKIDYIEQEQTVSLSADFSK